MKQHQCIGWAVLLILIIAISGCLNRDVNTENMRGNVPGNHVVAEGDGVTYFGLHNFIYRQIGEARPERILSGAASSDRKMSLSKDDLYYIVNGTDHNGLYRLNIADSNQNPSEEMVAAHASSFSLFDHGLFYYNEKDKYIYTLDMRDGFTNPQALKHVRPLFLLETDGDEVLYLTGTFKESFDNTYYMQLWRMNNKGEEKMILESASLDQCRPYQGNIYYLNSDAVWRMDQDGENRVQIYASDEMGVAYFVIYKERIYIMEQDTYGQHHFRSLDLSGEDWQHIFSYKSPALFEEYNGIIDFMHLIRFNVAEKYLILEGFSYFDGQHFITRFPIAGDPDQKTEEVFLGGQWTSYKDYGTLVE